MKLHLPSLLLVALLALITPAPAEDILAGGVDAEKISDSTHFFDMGKGSYGWNQWQPACQEAATLWTEEGGGYGFLGDLETRVPEAEKNANAFSDKAFSAMKEDTLLCWAYTSANMVQYWQSTYGVFYRGDAASKPLPHGLTYDKGQAGGLTGTMSLDVGMQYYDSWTDKGGYISNGLSWYLKGSWQTPEETGDVDAQGKPIASVADAAAPCGYFADYSFRTPYSTEPVETCVDSCGSIIVNSNGTETSYSLVGTQELASHLGWMLGYAQDEEGQFFEVEKGHIAGMSVYWNAGGGHAITVYGLSTDDAGNLVSVKVADSDDQAYGLYDLYLRQETMAVAGLEKPISVYGLYEDADFKTAYNGGARLGEFYGISWSQELYAMRFYYDNNPLLWSGAADTWVNAPAGAETEFLPDAGSGWTVWVEDPDYIDAGRAGAYDSFFYSGRMVGFDDSATSSDVVLGEDVSVSVMEIANDDKPYSFSGGHRIEAEQVLKHGSNTATLEGVGVQVSEKLTVKGEGALQLGEGATLEMGAGESPAYTLARRGEEGVGSLTFAELTPTSISGTGGLGGLQNVTLTVAENGLLTLQDMVVGADSLLTGGSGATLEVFNVTLLLSNENIDLASPLTQQPLLTGRVGDAMLTAMEPTESIVLEISSLEGLALTGESLTLDLSLLDEATRESLLAAGNVQFTFADSVSLDEVSRMAVTMNGRSYATASAVGDSGRVFSFYAGDAVPEPTTATLGLLALAALVGRRRRQRG